MAELDEPGDEPNFDLFGSFGFDFFSDDELLLTETDLNEQTETTSKLNVKTAPKEESMLNGL